MTRFGRKVVKSSKARNGQKEMEPGLEGKGEDESTRYGNEETETK